jgi:hypothetical protein
LNSRLHWGPLAAALAFAPLVRADIIDRIAVSVGSSVITTSDLDREIRVTGFLNGIKPDFSQEARRATAERMVEQKLVRRELELSKYPVPEASAAGPELERFKKSHYKTEQEFQRALAEYGLTEQDVKDELLWQLTLLRFIEVRFRPGVQVSDQEIEDYFDKVVKPVAQAAHPGQPVSLEDYREQIEETLTGKRADQEVDNWLKQTRRRTEIDFHEEAFE